MQTSTVYIACKQDEPGAFAIKQQTEKLGQPKFLRPVSTDADLEWMNSRRGQHSEYPWRYTAPGEAKTPATGTMPHYVQVSDDSEFIAAVEVTDSANATPRKFAVVFLTTDK